jgi:WD40 repeat protein
MEFHDIIQLSPLQVYIMAELFSPTPQLSLALSDRKGSSFVCLKSKRSFAWPPQFFPAETLSHLFIFPSGSQILTSGFEDVRVLDAWTGTPLLEFQTQGTIEALSLSPDGSYIAIGRLEVPISTWDSATGEFIRSYDARNVTSLTFSPDGARIASGHWDSTIYIWDFATGAQLMTLKGHSKSISQLIYSPDNSFLVSCSADDAFHIWDSRSGVGRKPLNGHQTNVNCIDISSDSASIASGSDDETLIIWNALSGEQIKLFRGHKGRIMTTRFAAQNTLLISGSDDTTVRIWNILSGKCAARLFGHAHWISHLVVSPCGTRFFSASLSGIMISDMVNLHTSSSQSSSPSQPTKPDHAPQLARRISQKMTHTRARLSTFLRRPHSTVFDTQANVGTDNAVTAMAASTYSVMTAVGYESGEVRLFDETRQRCLEGHSGAVQYMAFSSDGRWLASTSDDSTCYIWDTRKGKAITNLRDAVDKGMMSYVAFSPDRSLLVAAQSDGRRLWVWSTATWQIAWSLEDNGTWWDYPMSFSPDSHLLASKSNSSVFVWNAANGDKYASMQVSEDFSRLTFSDDGSRIVAVGPPGCLQVWDARTTRCPVLDEERIPSCFFVHEDDWLYGPVSLEGPIRRLCWIPPTRNVDYSQVEVHQNVVTLVSKEGHITRFDISELLRYLASIQQP